ncbi:DUF1501 domain-containing protein [Candidatus Laterigemmans baculatus]|uniref:DUF1501 domain-containing protein n=1 Tax=Candidatus Laterigemmans baculatus TaxID=2770505 RepID=UPI0013DA116B|nr:DUF1501 domain-containing protein [Candidatus Laterigemmans baculatus]
MTHQPHSRRHFLMQQSFGLGGLALAWMLQREPLRAAGPAQPPLEPVHYDLTPKKPPRPPRATAMISMFMQGGPSHIDLFDPKPELSRLHMKTYTGEIKYDNAAGASSKLYGSPWKFSKYGESGMELSELVSNLGSVADDICMIRSMHTGVNNHGQSINAMNTGRITAGRPSLGSWMTYALGSEADNLPAFVVLSDPKGLPVLGVDNWRNGWLPSIYQGTVVRPTEPRILNLDPPPSVSGRRQERFLSYLQQLNQEHLAENPGETDLEARIQSYELAAKMQTSAKEALDLSQETAATLKRYGIDNPETKDYASRCLIARRLVERGVRFVQIYTGNQTWDHHSNIGKLLPAVCGKTDQPAAALVADLKERGLLDTTLVHWGGEMGRLPVIENEKNIGRDHNTYGFSMWLAGGGIEGGKIHGATDELGHRAVSDIVNHYDYHATLLHLFGLDHNSLNFQQPTGVGSLVDGQEARIVEEILKHPV